MIVHVKLKEFNKYIKKVYVKFIKIKKINGTID